MSHGHSSLGTAFRPPTNGNQRYTLSPAAFSKAASRKLLLLLRSFFFARGILEALYKVRFDERLCGKTGIVAEALRRNRHLPAFNRNQVSACCANRVEQPPPTPSALQSHHASNTCRSTSLWRKRDPYSMTSSARASSVGGTVMPSAFAALRLTTSSNFVGCTTGKSAGLVPWRILPV